MPEPVVMLSLLVAHPGHGASAPSLIHYLSDVYHALPLAAAVGIGVLVMTAFRRRGRARR